MFEFRLQKVLDYRETVEGILMGDLRSILAAELDEQDKLQKLLTRQAGILISLSSTESGNPKIDDILLLRRYLDHLDEQIAAQKESVKRIGEAVELKRLELIRALKDKKVLERLRVHKHDAYIKEELDKEEKHVDEIVITKFAREA